MPHSIGPYPEPNQPNSSYWYLFLLRSILIFSSRLLLGLPKGLFLVAVHVTILKTLPYFFHSGYMTWASQSFRLNNLTILGERYKLGSSSLWILLRSPFASLLGTTNILNTSFFSNFLCYYGFTRKYRLVERSPMNSNERLPPWFNKIQGPPKKKTMDITCRKNTNTEATKTYIYDPVLFSLPSSFLIYSAILLTSFRGKGPLLNRWLVTQPSSSVSYLRFSGIFLSCKLNARRSDHSLHFHLIFIIISRQTDWRGTRSKWPLTMNPFTGLWHHHTSLKVFFFLSAAYDSMCSKYIVNGWNSFLPFFSLPPWCAMRS